jgi:hypothetical protein
MGMFGGIKDARSFGKGNYLDAGFLYVLEIIALKAFANHERHEKFVAEFRILQSNNPRQPAGSTASWGLNFTKHPQTAPGNFKDFLQTLTGVDLDKEIDDAPGTPGGKTAAQKVEDFCSAMVSAANPCGGRRIGCETFLTKTKAKQTDFTVHRWEAVQQAA